MKLIGKKIALRPLTEKDLPICLKWVQDPEVTKYTRFPFAKNLKEEQKWFRDLSKNQNERLFAIVAKDSGKYIGNMGVHHIDTMHKRCFVGILIGDKNYWNKGFGTDAMKTLLQYCFKNLKMHRVALTVLPQNKGGLRCYEKCGFRKEGVLKDESFYKGKFWDCYIMAVIKK